MQQVAGFDLFRHFCHSDCTDCGNDHLRGTAVKTISSIPELENLYGTAVQVALDKVSFSLTPLYRAWIGASKFLILSTVGPDGTDASPRGDVEPVVRIADDTTLLLPDWRGNNRLDSLRNIVADGRTSLLFMVPGCNNVVRVNGVAVLTADPELTGSFARNGKSPKTVIIVTVSEVYFQCAKALMRSGLWSGEDNSGGIPTAGDFIREFAEAGFDADRYDRGYSKYAQDRMW